MTSGEIAWRADKFCGIRFDSAIDVDEWVRKAGHAAQQKVDVAVAEFRSEGWPKPLVRQPSGSPMRIDGAVSELMQICERIAALPCMTMDLAEELLKIEAILQAIRNERCR